MKTTILNYNPRSGHASDKKHRVYFIWPTLAWRIAAPEASERRLNTFQRTLLELCRAGVRSAEDAGGMLGIEPDLVRIIAVELANAGWVQSKSWVPTEDGLRMLKDEEEEALGNITTGWVFQDPWTKELWPYFGRQLELQETNSGEARNVVNLVFGREARRWNVKAGLIPLPDGFEQPSPQKILDASCRHNRRERLRRHLSEAEEQEADLPEADHGKATLDRITLIGSSPERAGLVTYAYPEEGGPAGWRVCDPFGFGLSDDLRRRLKQLADSCHSARQVTSVIEGRVEVVFGSDFTRLLELQRERAADLIVKTLTVAAKESEQVYANLVAQAESLDRARSLPAESWRLNEVMHEGRKVLEAVLREVMHTFPIRNQYDLLTDNPAADRETINRYSGSLGILVPVPENFLPSLRRRKSFRNFVRSAAQPGNVYKLKAVVINMLLCAGQNEAHPFAVAARKDPDVLQKIAHLINWGNQASHARSRDSLEPEFTLVEAETAQEYSLTISALLLKLPYDTEKETNHVEEKES
jgi:hypothetical protein